MSGLGAPCFTVTDSLMPARVFALLTITWPEARASVKGANTIDASKISPLAIRSRAVTPVPHVKLTLCPVLLSNPGITLSNAGLNNTDARTVISFGSCALEEPTSAKMAAATNTIRLFMVGQTLTIYVRICHERTDVVTATLIRRFAPPSPSGRRTVLKGQPSPTGRRWREAPDEGHRTHPA